MTDWPPFSTDEFLDTLRDVYMPGARKAVVECEGVRVRTLVQGRNRAVSGFFPFTFYLEPLPAELHASATVPMLADVQVALLPAGEAGPSGAIAAPLVRWREFDSWDDFVTTRVSPPGIDSVKTIMRKARRIARDIGDLELQLVDPNPDVFDTLIRWKSEQYGRTGGINRLAVRQNVDFYQEMRRRGLFTATSLRAGGHLLGGKIAFRVGGRHLSRMTVYNVEYAGYSPGSVLDLETLRASFEAGDTEFDFLMGSQARKFTYATHVRWLGRLGREPRSTKALRVVRARIGGAARNRKGYATYKELVRRGRRLFAR